MTYPLPVYTPGDLNGMSYPQAQELFRLHSNPMKRRFNTVIDVAAVYGSTVDGNTDNTADIQAAITLAASLKGSARSASIPAVGPTVYLRQGAWRITDTLVGSHCPILGDGPFSTYVIWDGVEGGTAYQRGNASAWMQGLRWQYGTTKPGIWVDLSTDANHDYGDWIRHCYFTSWSQSAGVCALYTGHAINTQLTSLRFGGGKGFCIINESSVGGRVDIDDFTVDAIAAGDGNFRAVLNIRKTGAGSTVYTISRARIESTNLDWAADGGLILLQSVPANNFDQLHSLIAIDDIDFHVNSATDVSFVHQETTQTNVRPIVSIRNVRRDGVDNVLGGTWPADTVIPPMPTGFLGWMTLGNKLGSTVAVQDNWWAQQLHIGREFALPVFTDGTRPAASSVKVGTTIWNSDDNAPNFSDGTNWRDAAGSVT